MRDHCNFTKTNKYIGIILIFLPTVICHTWMTCPKSFVDSIGRGGYQNQICEHNGDNAHITNVYAGDRLKVGWTSNNHAGGYVRLSLVKFGDHRGTIEKNKFLINVLKYVCYGHDRALGINHGDCVHPCGARGGCYYQSDQYDIERYDTTVKIPTNLAEGFYVLQGAFLLGNAKNPYYSCAKLYIRGGNTNLKCQSNEKPLVYSCQKAPGGQPLGTNIIRVGAKRGYFCYRFDNNVGSVDDNLRDHVPINVECDPRLSCDNSVKKSKCLEISGMKDIVSGDQPGCKVWDTVPPVLSSCTDDIANRDEEGVDCGGSFCRPCPSIPSNVGKGEYFSGMDETIDYWGGGNGANFKIDVLISKNISDTQCWQLVLQYPSPIQIDSVWGNNAQVVDNNDARSIYKLERVDWFRNPRKGNKITIYFTATNPQFKLPEEKGKVIWGTKLFLKEEPMKLTTASFLDVLDDKSQCMATHKDGF